MARERIAPAGEADELIFKALAQGDGQALAALRAHLPDAVVDGISRASQGLLNPDGLRRLAGVLEGGGLVAAAAAALGCLAEALPMGPERVEPWTAIVALEERLGLASAAQSHRRLIRRLSGEGNAAERAPELCDGELAVRCAFNDSDRHMKALIALPGRPLAEDPLRDPVLARRSWDLSARHGRRPPVEDLSFMVEDGDGRALILVECDVTGDRYMGCREAGVEITVVEPAAPGLEAARELALLQLEALIAWSGCPHCLLDLPEDAAPSPALAKRLPALRHAGTITYRQAWIDLSQSAEEIEMGYRQTTRQSVRWGRENMELRVLGDAGLDVPGLYADMHAKAGRNPAMPGWQLEALLADGTLGAVAGYWEGEAAALLLTSRHGSVTYEMSMARGLDTKKPVTHILIHRAIMEAKAEGQSRFHFGPLYEGGEAGGKVKSIATFKAGFATSFENRLMLRLGV